MRWLAVLLAAACSLPLPHGVHTVGEVSAPKQPGGPLQVIPPGPQPGAAPAQVVLGFLGAQADASAHHAVARRFLRPPFRTAWRDDAEVRVYDPDRLEVVPVSTDVDRAVVRVTYAQTGGLRTDGSYVVGTGRQVTEEYDLELTAGNWEIAEAPVGLRLTEADRQRSFLPQDVFFLAARTPDGVPHLVPDRVFVPSAGDLATELVTRLLAGPSRGIDGSVTTAVPPGARLRGPVAVDGAGQATVDLTGTAAPSGAVAADLAAQLVWTLEDLGSSLRSVRLRVDGAPVAVHGSTHPLVPDDWGAYDANPLGAHPPYYFVSQRSPRVSVEDASGNTRDRGLVAGQPFPVDALAVTPDRARAAMLEREAAGRVIVRVGSLGGTAFPVVLRGTGLTSPSWGSAELGLWLVQGSSRLLLVPGGSGRAQVVPIRHRPAGLLTAAAVSRDGARIALVIGEQLYVGRIELQGVTPVVTNLSAIAPGLRHVTRVAWSTSTEVVALGVVTQAVQVVRVAVDGSSVTTLNSAGLAPTALAAAPDAVVVVSARHLFLFSGGAFRQVQGDASSEPVYPG